MWQSGVEFRLRRAQPESAQADRRTPKRHAKSKGGEEAGFGGEDGDGGESGEDGDGEADFDEFGEADARARCVCACAGGGELKDD